jgi:hypothetical protein
VSLSYRAATRRHCLILLKNRSIEFAIATIKTVPFGIV